MVHFRVWFPELDRFRVSHKTPSLALNQLRDELGLLIMYMWNSSSFIGIQFWFSYSELMLLLYDDVKVKRSNLVISPTDYRAWRHYFSLEAFYSLKKFVLMVLLWARTWKLSLGVQRKTLTLFDVLNQSEKKPQKTNSVSGKFCIKLEWSGRRNESEFVEKLYIWTSSPFFDPIGYNIHIFTLF